MGNEVYGKFLFNVLHDEGINMVEMSDNVSKANCSSASLETLLCWVLVDPLQRHGFCRSTSFELLVVCHCNNGYYLFSHFLYNGLKYICFLC